jgi:DNA excision repair protein ERCC-4
MSLFFHKLIFTELLEEDGLLIISRGLGINKVIQKFLHLYCGQQEIVFALNFFPSEQQLLIEKLQEDGVPERDLPKRINSENTMQERSV